MLEPTLEARDAPMTRPTAKVFDNQDTSSSNFVDFLEILVPTVIVGTILVMMLFFGMSLLYAIFAVAGIMILFAFAAMLFAAASPLLVGVLGFAAIVFYAALAVVAVVSAFVRGFFGVLFNKKTT
jgi:hypothetical protein